MGGDFSLLCSQHAMTDTPHIKLPGLSYVACANLTSHSETSLPSQVTDFVIILTFKAESHRCLTGPQLAAEVLEMRHLCLV